MRIPSALFVELGLDSLALTQVATQMQKTFGVKVTFRQLMESYSSLDSLARHLDASMPPDAVPPAAAAAPAPAAFAPVPVATAQAMPAGVVAMPPQSPRCRSSLQFAADPNAPFVRTLIEQQMHLMAQQLALLRCRWPRGVCRASAPCLRRLPSVSAPAPVAAPHGGRSPGRSLGSLRLPPPAPLPLGSRATKTRLSKTYDVKKAFGAIARIHTKSDQRAHRSSEVAPRHLHAPLHRAHAEVEGLHGAASSDHLADPRVVNGFGRSFKEMIYQIVIERSKGSRVWDLDGNEYIDALNGFGMSLFGWQPDWILDRVQQAARRGL